MDLRTTLTGLELTLDTVSEISHLLKKLDEQLTALSPDFPKIGAGSNAAFKGFTSELCGMLAEWEQSLSMMASRSALLLGHSSGLTTSAAAAAPPPVATTARSEQETTVEHEPTQEVATAEVEAEEEPEEELPSPEPTPLRTMKEPLERTELVWEAVTPNGGHKWSYAAAEGAVLGSKEELSTPLKPVETPSAEFPAGPLHGTSRAVIYGHGKELRKFWPSSVDSKVTLDAPLPQEGWRLLELNDSVFCVEPNRVSVVNLSNWVLNKHFPGKYMAHTRTDIHWAGIFQKDGKHFVDWRDASGNSLGTPVEFTGEPRHFVGAGDCVFIGTAAGDILKVGATSVESISSGAELASLALDERGIFAVRSSDAGIEVSLLSVDGNPFGSSATEAHALSCEPVLLGEYYYLFDSASAELLVGSLETLEVLQKKSIPGAGGVQRMFGIDIQGSEYLAVLATDGQGKPTEVFLHSPTSGELHQISKVNMPNADLAYTNGHLVLSSYSAYQNMIQVFGIVKHAAGESLAA